MWLKKILGLGIVQSSRSSLRRADASDERPARRIAGGEALFQAFVDLVIGRRSSGQLRLALAPRNRGPMPLLCNGPGHHVTGRIPGAAADAAGARCPRAVIVLMIHLPPAPAHRLRTPSGLSRWPKPIHGPAHWSKRAFRSADQTPHALRSKRGRPSIIVASATGFCHTPRYAACTRSSARSCAALPLVAIRPVSTT
jgi:hypothetical protein